MKKNLLSLLLIAFIMLAQTTFSNSKEVEKEVIVNCQKTDTNLHLYIIEGKYYLEQSKNEPFESLKIDASQIASMTVQKKGNDNWDKLVSKVDKVYQDKISAVITVYLKEKQAK